MVVFLILTRTSSSFFLPKGHLGQSSHLFCNFSGPSGTSTYSLIPLILMKGFIIWLLGTGDSQCPAIRLLCVSVGYIRLHDIMLQRYKHDLGFMFFRPSVIHSNVCFIIPILPSIALTVCRRDAVVDLMSDDALEVVCTDECALEIASLRSTIEAACTDSSDIMVYNNIAYPGMYQSEYRKAVTKYRQQHSCLILFSIRIISVAILMCRYSCLSVQINY
jgi:hypothetical protein